MTAVLVIAGSVAALIALILILPCEACRRRRERLHAALEEWRRTNSDH